MSEDIYAKPDLTKKVRFETSEKDRNAEVDNNSDNVTIYDNCWAEGITPPKLQDSTEDQQQAISVSVPSGKRNLVRPAAVFMVLLLILLLLTVCIVLVALLIRDKNLKAILTQERDELWTSYSDMKSVNANLTLERAELQANYSDIERLTHNLTQKTNQLERDIDVLKAAKYNLTKERDRLEKQLESLSCPDNWIGFGKSCYFISTSQKTWYDSKKFCENEGALLVIISSNQEQKFVTDYFPSVWIGLTDEEEEKSWKWVDGTVVTTTYWADRQPDNARSENCVQMFDHSSIYNWNDRSCNHQLNYVCEKVLIYT